MLTVENGQFPARDESLLQQIPDDVKVIRTHIAEPYDIYRKLTGKKPGTAIDVNTIKKEGQKTSFKDKIAEFIRATFFIPDARIGWYRYAKQAVDQLMKEAKIDAVYSSSPPYTCSIIARYVKRKYNLPWVAGFRDPWTGFISSPKRWFLPQKIDRKMEHSVFREADVVECAWMGIIHDAMGKYSDLDRKKFVHIPNGFDSADLPEIQFEKNKKFTVTYTGSLYGRRNPETFFKAVQRLIDAKFFTQDDICLRFVGRFGNEVEEMFKNAKFHDAIEIIHYVPHDKSIEYLMSSDALLLIVDESKESAEIVPGKVYEYVGVKHPIIAIAPHGSAIEALMNETKSGRVAHQSEIEQIAEIIKRYYNYFKDGDKKYFAPIEDKVAQYERRNSAKRLAGLLNTFVSDEDGE